MNRETIKVMFDGKVIEVDKEFYEHYSRTVQDKFLGEIKLNIAEDFIYRKELWQEYYVPARMEYKMSSFALLYGTWGVSQLKVKERIDE